MREININDLNVTYKRRITLEETILFVNEAVEACFSYNEETKTEEYNPILQDFVIKAAVVRHYSNYAERVKFLLSPDFKDDEAGLLEEVNNIDRLYNFCDRDIILTESGARDLGIDWKQLETLITAVNKQIAHRVKIIENCAPVNLFMKRFDESVGSLTGGLSEILSVFSEKLDGADMKEIANQLMEKTDPKQIVNAYLESDEKKRKDKEAARARRERAKRHKKAKEEFEQYKKNSKSVKNVSDKIIPMKDYKSDSGE